MSAYILEIKNITKLYKVSGKARYLRAVDDISFAIKQGEIFGLVGESGCGKTTLGHMIGGILPATSGEVFFKGDNIKLETQAIKKGIQMIFQDPYSSLNPRKKIGWILSEPLRVHTKMSKEDMKAKVHEMLAEAGLDESYYDQYPHQLSGGQRQRIGILCALMLNPDLIIADEPVSSLDVSIQASLLNFMRELQQKYKLTYLFISHDLNVVQHISDQIGVMYMGRFVEVGHVDAIYHSPLHPYTKLLLSAIPSVFDDVTEFAEPLEKSGGLGVVRASAGCAFHARCLQCMNICKQGAPPPLVEVSKGHYVACHLINLSQ